MMQQNRDRNGRPRNTRPYDLNRDVARTSAPSQNNTPRSTGSSRYGYNGEPLSRPPSRSANGSVRSSRADNSIQFPTQSQNRRPAQGSNTTQHPSGSRPKNAKSGGKQRRPANNARSGQNSQKNQNYQNANRQHPAGSGQRLRPAQSAPQQSPARREQRKKRKVTRATLRRRRMLRRLTAFAMLLCVIGAGIYLTMTMLFRINSIQVQTPDGKQVTEIAGYSADSILQRMGVQLEENIFSFEPGEKAAVLEQNFPLLGSIKVIRDYPNTVVVQVTEAVPAYAVQNGSKWLVISDKWKILSEESTQPEGLCTLYGGKLQDTTPGQGFWFVDDADAASASGSEAAESESAVSTETARMEALRTLRSKLEEYGLSQDVTRLEVADTEQIAFLYQDRISVLLGTLNDLDYKLDRARYVLTNADGKGCGPTDTGRLDFSHTSASSTRKIYFAQGEPTLPSGYVVPPKAEEPAPAEDTADSTESTEDATPTDTTEPAAETDTEQLPLTHPDRMTANEEENPM
ncbi:FtsQ-type POTRA domain-containing protein [Faecalibacterium sp. I3-3-33]|uniref:cell division protein FtsQ/DivIB n=1 Tax=Faecalibacterium sp. I3-3-33 TaxID=2929492 RepID=UPI002014B4D4|nr:FtsQ-type POTRA domain-containing protein [Faecalibacterium sp. I3-3-33]UQK45306.1 FtsQ-type POTRA domain-containing protein [Faecalibacterium sp. I3-3-33]